MAPPEPSYPDQVTTSERAPIDVDALLQEVIDNPEKFAKLAEKIGQDDDHYHRWVLHPGTDAVMVSFKIPDDWLKELLELGTMLKLNRSEVIRWVIYEFLIAPRAS